MESIYPSHGTNASDKLNIKAYFDEYASLLNYNHNTDVGGPCNLADIPLPAEELAQLKKKCNFDLLNSEGINPINDRKRFHVFDLKVDIPTNTNLKTLQKLQEKYTKYPSKIFRPSLKYQSENLVEHPDPIEEGSQAEPGKDILIFIRVYHPFNYCKGERFLQRRQKVALAHVIAILGSQTLADLRDHIQCLSELSVTTECSNNPTTYTELSNRDLYKSSFFYIENVFYNDMRDETNNDNSQVIRDWTKKHNLGPFYTANMEDFRIDSLSVRFGYPWVYQHQGNCEHLIVFSDARLVAADDDLAIANYPRVYRTKPTKHPSCMMCLDRSASWIIFESDRILLEPSYHCQKCFMSFNYVKGKKVGNFKAYRWPYDPELMKASESKK